VISICPALYATENAAQQQMTAAKAALVPQN